MKLFEPGKIGAMEVKNRIVMAPMGVGGMVDADGSWGTRVQEYYIARARGGTGLITTTVVPASQKVELIARHFLNLYSEKPLESLRKVVEGVHKHGAKISVQLTAGFGRVIDYGWQKRGSLPISASSMSCYFTPGVFTRALSTQEVEGLVQDFGEAAKHCQMVGVDAVEMHGHEGYLMDQFMTELWNKRDDKYGGSKEKRLTFVREILAAIRKQVGKDFPVIFRYAISHYLEGGRTVEDSQWIAKQLEDMGYDALHVDAGCYETSWWPHPPTYQPLGCMVDMAEAVKPMVKVPVITVGRLNCPSLAEKVLQEGKADFVAIGRALLADPDWPNKAREGKVEDIRPCIGDHDGCFKELLAGRTTSCTVNPACGHEKEWALKPIRGKKRLLIVGGGPAGIKAAQVAALRGLDVTLWEKAARLGGKLWPASVPEFKKDLRDLMSYQTTQLRKLPVKIELNKEATVSDVVSFGADSVIIANGAVQEDFRIPGTSGHKVIDTVSLLLNKPELSKDVVVIGAGLVGCEVSVYLAQNGHRVTVIEQLPDVLSGVLFPNRDMLLKMMTDHNVQLLTNCWPVKVVAEGVVVKHNGQDETLKAGSLVSAANTRSCNELREALSGKVGELYAVGDCVEPRNIMHAIWEAFHVARKIEA